MTVAIVGRPGHLATDDRWRGRRAGRRRSRPRIVPAPPRTLMPGCAPAAADFRRTGAPRQLIDSSGLAQLQILDRGQIVFSDHEAAEIGVLGEHSNIGILLPVDVVDDTRLKIDQVLEADVELLE